MDAARNRLSALLCPLAVLAAAACGGGGGGDPGEVGSIGGTVQGLTASGLRLQLAVGDGASVYHLDVSSGAAAFTFDQQLLQGTHYKVTIEAQPSGQTCTVSAGEGDMDSTPVRTIAVFCGTSAYGLGGTISGLADGGAEEVVLELNGQAYTMTANGPYAFPDRIPAGAGYLVTVQSPPPGKDCTIARSSGTMPAADVSDVDVTCSLHIPAKPVLSVGPGIKQLRFSWAAIPGAASYRFYENPDGSGFVQRGGDLTTTSHDLDVASVLHHDWTNARYRVDACNSLGCTASDPIAGDDLLAIGVFTGSNTEDGDGFGAAVALSADGNTFAIGADWEGSAATGVGGSQADNSATGAGAVYVFVHSAGLWTQQAYIKASNTGASDSFGSTLSLSADGDLLAVGVPPEASAAKGVGGLQTDDSASWAGAVYVFARSGTTWSQQAYIKASNTEANDDFGASVALSGDGTTLAVGASGEDSSADGIGGSQTDNSAAGAGAAYVFTRNGSSWSQQAYVKASNSEASDAFGFRLALSTDGSTLAVGAPGEDGAATGIGGTQNSNAASSSGAAYVFARSGSSWSQQAYVKASNTGTDDRFGCAVALSGDGNTLAVGAEMESGAATGVNGTQTDDSARWAGAAYVFTRSGTTWSQQAYVKASNTQAEDGFGRILALSEDGNTLAVAAIYESSSALGVGGSQSDNSAPDSGAVYVYGRSGTVWSQQSYVKRPTTLESSFGGRALSDGDTVALDGSGGTLAVAGGNAAYLY